MNQKTPKAKKPVNTLSVRLPPELYNPIAEKALMEGRTLNSVFIEMVELGLQREGGHQRIIEDFIIGIVSPERMRELLNGTVKTTAS